MQHDALEFVRVFHKSPRQPKSRGFQIYQSTNGRHNLPLYDRRRIETHIRRPTPTKDIHIMSTRFMVEALVCEQFDRCVETLVAKVTSITPIAVAVFVREWRITKPVGTWRILLGASESGSRTTCPPGNRRRGRGNKRDSGSGTRVNRKRSGGTRSARTSGNRRTIRIIIVELIVCVFCGGRKHSESPFQSHGAVVCQHVVWKEKGDKWKRDKANTWIESWRRGSNVERN